MALGLAATWLISVQTTSGPVLGLPPALLPTACTVAIVVLALLGLAARWWRPEPRSSEAPPSPWPAASTLGVALAGAAGLQFLGPFAGGLLIMLLGPLVLGERRLRVLLLTVAGTALALAIVFRAWR